MYSYCSVVFKYMITVLECIFNWRAVWFQGGLNCLIFALRRQKLKLNTNVNFKPKPFSEHEGTLVLFC